MSWMLLLVIVVGGWLALKVVGFALRLALWAAVIAAAYWLLAPHLGLPSL